MVIFKRALTDVKRTFFFSLAFIIYAYGYGQNPDSLHAKTLHQTAFELETNFPDSALRMYKEAFVLCEQLNDDLCAGNSLKFQGIVFSNLGVYDSALTYYQLALPYFEQADYPDQIASIWINIGNLYNYQGNYKQATEEYLKGIRIYEQVQNSINLATSYTNLASAFASLGQYQTSLEYQTKALDLSYAIGDSISIGYALIDVGITYLNLADYDKSLDYNLNAKIVADRSNDDLLKYTVYQALYHYYFKSDKLDLSLQYAQQALAYAKGAGNAFFQAYMLTCLGRNYFALNDYANAKDYLTRSLKLAKTVRARNQLVGIYLAFAELYEAQNLTDQALNYFKQYIQYKDSMELEKQAKYVASLENQYQNERKDMVILENKLKLEQQELQLQKRKMQNNYYVIGLIVMVLIILLLWLRYRDRQKIHNQKIRSLEDQQQLRTLGALIKGEDRERDRIAKDLHDSINGDLSAIKYNLTSLPKAHFKPAEKEVFENSVFMLDQACQQIRAISHDLAPPSLLNFGFIEALEQFCRKMDLAHPVQISLQYFGDAVVLSKKVETNLYRVVQELINNVIKHAQATETIVQVNVNRNKMHITVEDNGVGFDQQQVHNGLGLKNVMSRVAFLKASLEMKSDHKGTSVSIQIDLDQITEYD